MIVADTGNIAQGELVYEFLVQSAIRTAADYLVDHSQFCSAVDGFSGFCIVGGDRLGGAKSGRSQTLRIDTLGTEVGDHCLCAGIR